MGLFRRNETVDNNSGKANSSRSKNGRNQKDGNRRSTPQNGTQTATNADRYVMTSSEVQRLHKERLFTIGNRLVEESLVGGSRKSYGTDVTATDGTPPTGSPPTAHGFFPKLGFPTSPAAHQQQVSNSVKQEHDEIPVEQAAGCNMFELISSMHLCGVSPTAQAPQTHVRGKPIELHPELTDYAVPVPHEISFVLHGQTSWEDDHILLDQAPIDEDTTNARRSLLKRIKRIKGKLNRQNALPKMHVYVDKPKPIEQTQSDISADLSDLTEPAVLVGKN